MSNQHEPPTQSGVDLLKITIPLHESAWHAYSQEYIWAAKVEGGKYRIENIPFFAPNLSYHDLIEVEEKKQEFHIVDVAERSGNSTYRCHLRKKMKDENFKKFYRPLEELGCTFERSGDTYAINVPSRADYWKVYELFQEGEMAKVWDFEEGFRGHSLE